MRRSINKLSALAFVLLILAAGCSAVKTDDTIEEMLQLNNDILEDPLLKELDALEASLLIEGVPTAPVATDNSVAANDSSISDDTVSKAVVEPAVQIPSVAPSNNDIASQAVSESSTRKNVLFGIIRKASRTGISLQIIQAKTLTPEELKRIKNGTRVSRTLLTEEILTLSYNASTDFEKLENGIPVPARLTDIMSGQTVRVALNTSGEVKLLRIVRN